MGTRPIDRIVRWFAYRSDMSERPPVALECAECGKAVGPDKGAWFPHQRVIACSDECSFLVQADQF